MATWGIKYLDKYCVCWKREEGEWVLGGICVYFPLHDNVSQTGQRSHWHLQWLHSNFSLNFKLLVWHFRLPWPGLYLPLLSFLSLQFCISSIPNTVFPTLIVPYHTTTLWCSEQPPLPPGSFLELPGDPDISLWILIVYTLCTHPLS
jgi:hypothetical protein